MHALMCAVGSPSLPLHTPGTPSPLPNTGAPCGRRLFLSLEPSLPPRHGTYLEAEPRALSPHCHCTNLEAEPRPLRMYGRAQQYAKKQRAPAGGTTGGFKWCKRGALGSWQTIAGGSGGARQSTGTHGAPAAPSLSVDLPLQQYTSTVTHRREGSTSCSGASCS